MLRGSPLEGLHSRSLASARQWRRRASRRLSGMAIPRTVHCSASTTWLRSNGRHNDMFLKRSNGTMRTNRRLYHSSRNAWAMILRTVHDNSLHHLSGFCRTGCVQSFDCHQSPSAKFSTSVPRFAPSVPEGKPVASKSRPVKGPSTPPRLQYQPGPNNVGGSVRTRPGDRGSTGVLEARRKADEAKRLKESQLQQDLARQEQAKKIMEAKQAAESRAIEAKQAAEARAKEEARQYEAAEYQREVERLKQEWLMQQQRDKERATKVEEIRLQAIARVEQLRIEWPELDSFQRQDVVRKLQFSDVLRKVMIDRASLLYQDVSVIHDEQQRLVRIQREHKARELAHRVALEMRELARQKEVERQGGATIVQAQHRQIEVYATDQSAVKVQLRDRYRNLQGAFQDLSECVRSTHESMEEILGVLTITAKRAGTNALSSQSGPTNESSTKILQRSDDLTQPKEVAGSELIVRVADEQRQNLRELYRFTSLQWSRLAVDYERHSQSFALAAHDMRAIVRFRRFILPDEGQSELPEFRVLRQCGEIDSAHLATQTARSIFLEIDPLVNDKLPVNKLSKANLGLLSSIKHYSLTRRRNLTAGRTPVLGLAEHDPRVLATAKGKEVVLSLSPTAAGPSIVATRIQTLKAQIFRLNVQRLRHALTTRALAEQKLFHMRHAIRNKLASVSMNINAVNRSSTPAAIRSCVHSTQSLMIVLRSPIAGAGNILELQNVKTTTQQLLAALYTLREAALSVTGRAQIRNGVWAATKKFRLVFDDIQEWQSSAARWARHAEKTGLLDSESETLHQFLKSRIEELEKSPRYMDSPRVNTSSSEINPNSVPSSSETTTMLSRARSSSLQSRPRRNSGVRSVKPSHLGSMPAENLVINAPDIGNASSSDAAEPNQIQQDKADTGRESSSGIRALEKETHDQVTQDRVTSARPGLVAALSTTIPAVNSVLTGADDMDRTHKNRMAQRDGPGRSRIRSKKVLSRSRRRRTSKPIMVQQQPGEWGISNSVSIGGFHPKASLRAGLSGTTASNTTVEEDGVIEEDGTTEEDNTTEEGDVPDCLIGIDDQPENHLACEKLHTYKLSEAAVAAAQLAKPGQEVFWQYNLFRGPDGAQPGLHYCKSKDKVEEVAQHFLESDVLGFDMEWMPNAPKDAPVKDQVSLIQFASESRIALFQIALHKGTEIDDLVGPTLRLLLESPDIIKAGVGIKADCTRLERCLGVKAQGVFELTRSYKLIKPEDEVGPDAKKRRTGLAAQVKDLFGMSLHKGPVRYSPWKYELNHMQCSYAASDAYAGYQLFWELERHRLAMRPTPLRPAFVGQITSPKASQSTVSEPASSDSQL